MPDRTDVFVLPPDREAALWSLADALGIEPTASALTVVGRCLREGRGMALHAEGFGAASELDFHRRKGEAVQFNARPLPPPATPA